MASAEQFLQLLEEKDLVSAHVLQEARREMQRTSPPPDAVGMSLWLVQGQHITASQAERLLAAVMAKAGDNSSFSRWQKGEPKPTEVLRAPIPPPPAPPKFTAHAPESPSQTDRGESPPRAPQSAAQGSLDDLELAPEPAPARAQAKKPIKSSSPAAKAPAAATAQTTAPQGGPKPAGSPKAASVGGALEPLDSLIESEAGPSSPFDDSMDGPSLSPTAPKKFKLRYALRKLFRRNKSKTVQVKAADPRHVKLLLFSWGVAILFILAALAIFRYFSPDAAEMLRKAEAAVDRGDYTEAISQYDKFLKTYPKTSESDEVRTLRVLAELRQTVQLSATSGDWPAALEVAQREVPALSKTASTDLLQKIGLALARIAEGLSKQAQAKPDESSLARLRQITNIIDGDIPANARPTEMLDGISRALRQCTQTVEGRKEIEQTVDKVGKAVAAGDLPTAYAAYGDLVRSFPALVDNPDLTSAMKQVSAAQQKAVKTGEQSLAVARDERPTDLIAAMPLAVQPVQGALAAEKGKMRFVVTQGTVYGLDTSTGKLLWRRFVADEPPLAGGKPDTARQLAVSALPVVDAAGSDVAICDPVRQEVMRVKGRTGGLVWRLAVGQPITAGPVKAGKSLLLLTQDSRLLIVDAATGKADHYLELPQSVRLKPVVDDAHGLIYLVAQQSNIYVLAYDPEAGGTCRQVLHLGHDAGTIAATPSVVGDYLFVPVNDGPDEATIRVLSIAATREPLTSVQRISVKGYIDASPAAMGGGAIAVTAQGGIVAMQRTESVDKPFRVTARVEPALDARSVHYTISDGRTFWVTGPQLTRYAVQSADGQIATQASIDLGTDFLDPPSIEGGTIFTVTRRIGLPGAMVTALDSEKTEPVWQTWLAAPLAAAPTIGSASGKLTAVTASGGMFRLAPADLRPTARPAEPVLSVPSARLSKPLNSLVSLPEERYAISSGAETTSIAVYDPQEQDRYFRWLATPHELSAAPASFAGGVLAPCLNGQIFLLDPLARRDMLAKSYTISLPGVTVWNWRTPQPVDDTQAILCDGDHRVIAVRLTDGASPMLTEAKAAPLSKAPLVSPVAVLGKSVFVADADDNLQSFVLPELSPGKATALGGHCVWGPQTLGKLVLLSTDKQRLIAVDDRQQVLWQVDLKFGPLAGVPLAAGDAIYLSSQSGVVWRVSAADGKELGKADAGCPLGTGPVLVGPRLIVGGRDGSLLEVKKP
jgi:outer membrane protein assembly factor BamB